MVNITSIITGLIFLLGVVLSIFVIPWIKEKRSEIKDVRIQKAVDSACKWAQQKLEKCTGPEKREKVLNYIKGWLELRGYTYDVDEVSIYLEASVWDINNPAQTTVNVESSGTITLDGQLEMEDIH